ncbi:T9SS type A sorting domain-containing protein [Rosettibacter firmus]|uniref:T9SS type A sorting domain-containing protein n=1 Tax=Rosettibacter firmus TaxID=3111522 RepID=UPI00336BEB0F
MWGDSYDAFDQTYNNVFSPVSNPRSINNAGVNFTIETTGSNSIAVYFTNPYAGSPSKPQNFHRISLVDNHPTLQWDLNSEPDIASYKIYRSYDNSPFYIAGAVSHPSNTFVDVNVDYTKPIWDKPVKYYVAAVDNTNKYSVPSDQVETIGIMNPLPKINTDDLTNTKAVDNFELLSNYPNPFNPSTRITYSLPEASFVTLKVYDILGREIVTLVNETKPSGKYAVEFDASKLPSGTYIYQLTAGNNQTIKKMLLLK